MLALVAELAPLGEVVGSLVEDVDLSVGSIRTHDVLLDGIPHSDCLDKLVEGGERILPFLRRNDFDNARLHSILVDLFHLYGVRKRVVSTCASSKKLIASTSRGSKRCP